MESCKQKKAMVRFVNEKYLADRSVRVARGRTKMDTGRQMKSLFKKIPTISPKMKE